MNRAENRSRSCVLVAAAAEGTGNGRKEEKTAPHRRVPNLPHALVKPFSAFLITRISESAPADAGEKEALIKFRALWFPSARGSMSAVCL